ncbi:hypothetical protein T265_14051, partial [Opisthorchis viverrini]
RTGSTHLKHLNRSVTKRTPTSRKPSEPRCRATSCKLGSTLTNGKEFSTKLSEILMAGSPPLHVYEHHSYPGSDKRMAYVLLILNIYTMHLIIFQSPAELFGLAPGQNPDQGSRRFFSRITFKIVTNECSFSTDFSFG